MSWRVPRLTRALAIVVPVAALLAIPAAARPGNNTDPASAGCDHSHHVHPSPTHLACLAAERQLAASLGADRDLVELSDDPANWFRSTRTGTSVTTLPVGGRVDFVVGELTDTHHTATLLSKAAGIEARGRRGRREARRCRLGDLRRARRLRVRLQGAPVHDGHRRGD